MYIRLRHHYLSETHPFILYISLCVIVNIVLLIAGKSISSRNTETQGTDEKIANTVILENLTDRDNLGPIISSYRHESIQPAPKSSSLFQTISRMYAFPKNTPSGN